MIGWLARQGHNARQLIGMIASGQTRELLYELAYRRKGLDLDSASVEALRLPASRAHWYSNSGGPQLERVLKTLRIPTGSVGLDLGCGKGGAAITLAQLPFTRVTGVDLSADLVRIATENVRRLGLTHVGFVHADASAFTDLDPYTHIYMVQPVSLRDRAGRARQSARLAGPARTRTRPHLQESALRRCHRGIGTLHPGTRAQARRTLVVHLPAYATGSAVKAGARGSEPSSPQAKVE